MNNKTGDQSNSRPKIYTYIHTTENRVEQNRTEPIILNRNKTRNITETKCFIKNYSKREKKRKEGCVNE